MRLIDADYLKQMFDVACGTNRNAFDIADAVYKFAIKTIDDAPTVCNDNYSMGYQDGVKKVLSERPTGHWIEIYDCNRCSECDYTWRHFKTDFCPTCGADMREETENEADN